MSDDLDAEAIGYEGTATTGGLTAYLNGDDTDIRPYDAQGVVVGLLAKGKAKQDTSGFVVRQSN